MVTAQQLTPAEVTHVAKLARLELSPDRVETYRSQLTAVLGHIAKLNEVDMAGVEPMAHPFDASTRLADDVPAPSMPIEDVLLNAPATEGRFLAVPKVLADEE
ncbi:MAG: Asp-tRNA(Asn)/Glu-tRNA(Gln) amidotransferase subunit GatC [Phycisphaerales bacterium]